MDEDWLLWWLIANNRQQVLEALFPMSSLRAQHVNRLESFRFIAQRRSEGSVGQW